MIAWLACVSTGDTGAHEASELGPVQRCPNPVPLGYDEVGASWGMAEPATPVEEHLDGGGLALLRLDDDRHPDLVSGFVGESVALQTGSGLGFRDPVPLSVSDGAVAAADMNRDGDIDLLAGGLTPWFGENVFEEFSFEYPDLVEHPVKQYVREMVLFDLDGDGILEIYAGMTSALGGEYSQDRLGRRVDGVYQWEDVGQIGARQAFDVQVFDWDGDGDLDVYVVNDHGKFPGANVMWENDDGTLVDASEECGCDVALAGMGASRGDYDSDGQADLYIAGSGHSVLLRAEGTEFLDVTAATGADSIADGSMAWGSTWLDHDNDGYLDLAVAQGDLWGFEDEQPRFEACIDLLANDGAGFTNVGPELGLACEGSHRAVLAEDLNADGVLDLVVSDVAAASRLYLSEGCTENAWLQVDAPLHSRIEVHAGGRVHTAWADGDPGYNASRSGPEHIGLGDSDTVDQLVVTELDGSVTVVAGPFDARRLVDLR